MDARLKKYDDDFNERWNKAMRNVNIGIGVSLSMFFGGIGMLIYGYIQSL